MRERIDPPAQLVDHQRIRFGTYAGPIADTNLIDAQPWSLPVPQSLRSLRLKEWQAFQFGNAQWFFVVALFDAKLLAMAQLKAYDREARCKYLFERQLPSWKLAAPRNMLDSQMHWAGGDASIGFVNRLADGTLELSIDLPGDAERPAISGKLTANARGCEPLVVCIPFAENRGMYSHKGCMALDGELTVGDRRVRFGSTDSFLLMDDHKGYYPRIMRWDWVTGGGFDAQGRRIGLNLTRNDSIDPDRYNENCVWVDGRVQLLPAVTFRRRSELTPEVWEIRDHAGDVEVDFEIELDGYVRVNAVVVQSRYRGPFGRLRGHVRGADGGRVEIDLFGMAEDFYLKC